MRMILAATLMLASTSIAAAQDMPRYDPVSYCNTVADTVGGSDMIKNGCIQNEQNSYDTLKASWPSISDRARNYCNDVAMTVGGTYQILLGCIQNETSAAASTPDFKF